VAEEDEADQHIMDSDDDDDGPEMIETLEAPEDAKVIYVRDFLDVLKEEKDRAGVESAFSALPMVARRQLALDHPALGAELVDVLFDWENEFDDPALDQHRRASLAASLVARPDPLVQHLCNAFSRDGLQPYRKNLVLQALADARDELPLAGRLLVARHAFSSLLPSPAAIRCQDVTVRVPMILFFAQTLCSLPPESISGGMVAGYLEALADMGSGVDAGTEQTARYALSKVMAAVGDSPRLGHDADVRTGAGHVRDWMVAIEAMR